MKKVLVTGASGSIGLNVIKYLLTEGKYEITALDLDNKKTISKLKKYKNRIKIVYGDVLDNALIEELVENNDYIIHLASVLPPLGDLNKNLGELIEYKGTENILKAINYLNPNCYLLYASTTSLYDYTLSANVKEKIKENSLNNFAYNKYQTEKLIKSKIKNFTIFRVPLVLSDLKDEPFIYSVKKKQVIEVTTNVDAANAFVKALDCKKELNKKTFNIGMGENGRIVYNNILRNILNFYGLSFRYILSRIFLEKNYNSPILTDSDDLEEILHYRTDTLNNYFKRLKHKGRKRTLNKIISKPLVWLKKK